MNKSANATLDSIPTRKPERNARRAKAGGKPPAWKVKLKKQADEASQRFQGVCCTEPATTISDCINDQKSLDDFHGALNALSRKHTRGAITCCGRNRKKTPRGRSRCVNRLWTSCSNMDQRRKRIGQRFSWPDCSRVGYTWR